jgi:hypothetical protein
MIKHCRRDDQVRDRTSGEPGLKGATDASLEVCIYWHIQSPYQCEDLQHSSTGKSPVDVRLLQGEPCSVCAVKEETHIGTPNERPCCADNRGLGVL